MRRYQCHWCRRPCFDGLSSHGPLVTKDHVWPKSKMHLAPPSLLNKIVMACVRCNAIKADLLPLEWAHLMTAFPKWWSRKPKCSIGVMQSTARQMAAACLADPLCTGRESL